MLFASQLTVSQLCFPQGLGSYRGSSAGGSCSHICRFSGLWVLDLSWRTAAQQVYWNTQWYGLEIQHSHSGQTHSVSGEKKKPTLRINLTHMCAFTSRKYDKRHMSLCVSSFRPCVATKGTRLRFVTLLSSCSCWSPTTSGTESMILWRRTPPSTGCRVTGTISTWATTRYMMQRKVTFWSNQTLSHWVWQNDPCKGSDHLPYKLSEVLGSKYRQNSDQSWPREFSDKWDD